MSKLFKTPIILAILGAIFVAVVVVLVALGTENKPATSGKLQVVAGENFWGSLAAQIGDDKVQVTNIVSDPNADPHEYETTTANARAVADANYVILNGAGYDAWGDKLLGASPNGSRKVLHVADLLGKKDADNPHFWYNPAYVNQVASQMEKDLAQADPTNAGYFDAQYKTLQAKLAGYQNRIAEIKQQFGGTQVAATEDMFAYLAQATGLDVVSPSAFTQAVAEGNDPPTSSVIQFQQQLQSGQVKVLVYNQQTTTPLTDSMKKLATDQGIPIVGITEIIQPTNLSFEDWMGAQIISLQNALEQ